MDYNKEDLKNIKFDIACKDYLKKYPELKRYPAFDPKKIPDLDFHKVFTYIACTYDKMSPLLHAPSLMHRKVEASKIADFPYNKKGVMESNYDAVIRCKNEAVNSMIIQYCRVQNDIEYTTLVAYREKLYDQIDKMMNNKEEEKTKDLIDNTEKLKRHIKESEYSLLNDDNVELTQDLVEQLENEMLELRPESIAKKTKRGEDI